MLRLPAIVLTAPSRPAAERVLAMIWLAAPSWCQAITASPSASSATWGWRISPRSLLWERQFWIGPSWPAAVRERQTIWFCVPAAFMLTQANRASPRALTATVGSSAGGGSGGQAPESFLVGGGRAVGVDRRGGRGLDRVGRRAADPGRGGPCRPGRRRCRQGQEQRSQRRQHRALQCPHEHVSLL